MLLHASDHIAEHTVSQNVFTPPQTHSTSKMSEWHERMLWQCSHVLATYDSSLRSVEEHVTNFISSITVSRKFPVDGQVTVYLLSPLIYFLYTFCVCVDKFIVVCLQLLGLWGVHYHF